MADSRNAKPQEQRKQRRAVREPVSSIWADLLPSEPELDDLDLGPLRQRGAHTSPALTAGDLERASVLEPQLEVELERGAAPGPTALEGERLERSLGRSTEQVSDEFDSFEALDEGLSDEQKSLLRRAREERERAASRAPRAEPVSALSESAERLTEPPLCERVERSWLVRFPALSSALTLLLLAALGVEIVSTTPYLEISEVSLSLKGSHITEEQVTQLLREGGSAQNILTYDHDGFVARLQAHPWVKAAEVTRALPQGLHVQLVEHEPAGVVVFRKLYAVNQRGELLAPLTPGQALSFPLISGVPQELFSTPEGSEVGRFLIRRGLRISGLYHELELDLLRPLSEVYVSETGYVELILKRTRVTLGKDDFERHLEDLREVLLTLKRKGVDAHYILLSSDFTRAIVKEAPLRVVEEEASHDL